MPPRRNKENISTTYGFYKGEDYRASRRRIFLSHNRSSCEANSSTVMRVWKHWTDEHRTTRNTCSGQRKVTHTRAFGDLVVLNHGQVTRTTPNWKPPLLTPTPHEMRRRLNFDRLNVHRPLPYTTGLQLYKARAHDTPVTYTRTFGDELRNFGPWSSDVDDTSADTPSPNYHTKGRTFELSTDFTCIASLHNGSLVVLVKTHAIPGMICYLDHWDTAAPLTKRRPWHLSSQVAEWLVHHASTPQARASNPELDKVDSALHPVSGSINEYQA
ncbi:hypothetical protein TNCV_1709621 [Trichonephila clavipes]|nr:hypothetical protein TNCV_1709621 [Trichonephila clavipes]